MDDKAVRFQNASLLARDLGLDTPMIAPARVRLAELRRTEEAAVLHAVERCVGQEVERTGPAQVDAVVLEALALEIATVKCDRLGTELDEQPSEPRFEHRGPLSRRGRAARVRTRRDVEDPFVLDARERSECTLQPADEFLDDRRELWLARHLAPELMALVQLQGRARKQRALGTRSRRRHESIEKRLVHYRGLMPDSPVKEPSREELLRIFAQPKTIAVVGASTAIGKPAHDIPRYLQSQGYRIIPVNPRGGEILGERTFASLADVDVPIDIVEVFRAVADSGMTIVTRRCMGVTHGLLGLGPGPHPRK